MYCTYCGSHQHQITLCPKTWGGSCARRNLWCSYCGAKDHSIRACPKTWAGCFEHNRDPNCYVKDK